jgi:hypothetical protein
MPRRALIRLLRLLAVACACLVPVAGAQAAAPTNDVPTAAVAVDSLGWTSLSVFQDVVVQASEWNDATTGPEDANPLPSCTGSPGFRSMWYYLMVPEAAVLRVTVVSTNAARYQPVVNVLDPANDEVGCGLANDLTQGSTANATAYVTPSADGTAARYLVRVAEVVNNTASGGQPTLTIRFAARDVTPPHVKVRLPAETVAPGVRTTYDATDTSDLASQVNPQTAHWEFHDAFPDKRPTVRTRSGLQPAYTWLSPGSHEVDFTVSDFAGNQAKYVFTTLVQDVVRPDVKFSLRPPMPGAHRIRITMHASESVHVRVLVTQLGRNKPLLQRTLSFWGDRAQTRSVPLRGGVGKGLLFISGFARDLAGNMTPLPQCVVDPVSGQGRCTPL